MTDQMEKPKSNVGITQVLTKQYRGSGFMTVSKYSSDGNLLYVGDKDSHCVSIIDTINYKIVESLEGHTGVIWDLALTKDNNILVSASGDLTFMVWNPNTGSIIKKINTSGIPKQISINETNNYLLVYCEAIGRRSKSYIYMYDLNNLEYSDDTFNTLEPIKIIEWITDETLFKITVLKWLNETQFIIGCDNGNIIIRDYLDDNFNKKYEIHTDAVKSIVYNNTKTIILTSSLDTTAKEINLETMEVIRSYQSNNPVNYAIYSYNEKKIILGGGIEAMMIAKSGNNDLTIKFFRISDQKLVNQMSSHFGPIRYMDKAPNNKNFVSASQDGTAKIYIFDENEAERLKTVERIESSLIDENTNIDYVNAKPVQTKKKEQNKIQQKYIPGMARPKEEIVDDSELFTVTKNYVGEKILKFKKEEEKINNEDDDEIYKPVESKPSTIRVSNLPSYVETSDLYELFEFYGRIEEKGIFIKRYPDNTMAFIKFCYLESAEKAIASANRKPYEHSILLVEMARN
jgi:translation initiation factor 3 subunit I